MLTLKFLVFLSGLAVAMGQIILYIISFRSQSVVPFQVYASQANASEPMKMLESDRDVGS